MPELPTIDIGATTMARLEDPLGSGLVSALEQSGAGQRPFLVRPSLPDPRMTAQEGLFIAGMTPVTPSIPGVESFPLAGAIAPGHAALEALFAPDERGPGRPRRLPFVALMIPPRLKGRIRNSLRDTYNRRRRVLFPDVAGLVEAFRLQQLNS
jgi:hypothetical protein